VWALQKRDVQGAGLDCDVRSSYLLYFVLCVRDNKWTQLRSSSWSRHSQEK